MLVLTQKVAFMSKQIVLPNICFDKVKTIGLKNTLRFYSDFLEFYKNNCSAIGEFSPSPPSYFFQVSYNFYKNFCFKKYMNKLLKGQGISLCGA